MLYQKLDDQNWNKIRKLQNLNLISKLIFLINCGSIFEEKFSICKIKEAIFLYDREVKAAEPQSERMAALKFSNKIA